MTLLPGDVITTGTPPGVGLGKKPPVYLKPGDVMTLGVGGLGEQRQEVRAFTPEDALTIAQAVVSRSEALINDISKRAQADMVAQAEADAKTAQDRLRKAHVALQAFRVGEKSSDPLAMYLSDVFTIPCNLAGLPGMSIPCGFIDNLPAGLQILGPALGEPAMFRAAGAYQRLTDWHQRTPTMTWEMQPA